jgi:hypothetical protein
MWRHSKALLFEIQFVPLFSWLSTRPINVSQAILKLEEDEDEAAYLSQYSVRYVDHSLAW